MDGSTFIDMKNIQSLAIEKFRDSRNLSPPIMNDIFSNKRKNSWYNLRQISKFSRTLVKLVYHRSESVSFIAPKIWGMLPDNCKDIDNLNTFKAKVKQLVTGDFLQRVASEFCNE